MNKLTRRGFMQTGSFAAVASARVGRVTATTTQADPQADARKLGCQRHLFLDDALIDIAQTRDVTRTLNPPRDIRRIMTPDKPWESLGFIFYSTVLEDEKEIKLYYGSYGWDGKILRNFCLATSQDGEHFERASLNQKVFDGKTYQTNFIFPTAIETSVFIDPTATPEKRYRMVYSAGGIDNPDQGGVYTATSPDGIHWERNLTRLLPFIPDSQHTAHWDARLKKYVIYTRSWGRERRVRQVCRIAVEEIDKPWPYDASVPGTFPWGKDKTPTLGRELPAVMVPDEHDPENLDVYTNVVMPYPDAADAMLAFPAVYFKFNGPEWKGRALSGNDGNFEVQLATSRDGITWDRWRQPYVAAGYHDGLDLRLVSMAKGMVRRGRWLYQYFVGWPHTHGRPNVWDRDKSDGDAWTKKDKGGIYLARQRVDGFVSMDSAYAGGVLTTKPVVFEGNRLCLNLDTRGTGSARVALLDEGGKPLPGFAENDCESINADDTDCVVKWKDGVEVSAWAGKPVRVQIAMRNTKLYALQFVKK